MDDPLPFGAEVSLEFRLPVSPNIIKCAGFVVWSTKNQPERSREPGCGVRLMEIGITEMRVLAEHIQTELGL